MINILENAKIDVSDSQKSKYVYMMNNKVILKDGKCYCIA